MLREPWGELPRVDWRASPEALKDTRDGGGRARLRDVRGKRGGQPPPKNVPELIAQAGPFLLTMHKAHDAFSFRRSDVAQGLALLAQEKQVSLSLKDHEVQDFVETMRCAA